jgi:hypothetical protein
MPKRKARPVTVSASQKGPLKIERRDSRRRAARGARRGQPCSRDEKDRGSGVSSGESTENAAKEVPRAAFAASG